MRIVDVVVGERHRKDMGDLDGLAQSISEIGLLHPIVVTPDNRLIAGQRRLEACKRLGWDCIPATVVDLQNLAIGERDENMARKDFAPSEAVAIAKALEPYERAAAKERQRSHSDAGYAKFTDPAPARDRVATAVGMSRPTLTKAQAVVEAAEAEPEKYAPILEQMDNTGKVDRAYKELQRARVQEAKAATPEIADDDRFRLIHTNIEDADLEADSLDAIVTDPPYPAEYLPLYGVLAAKAAKWLKPGGSLLAMAGQSYLPTIIASMAAHLNYHWTIAYLTPGGQSAQLWQRKVNTFWKPVLWFVKGEYTGDWVGDVTRSEMNDKRFHEWGQSEGGMADLLDRFTYPGQIVCDPFLGGGTTAIVAVVKHRRFIGMDSSADAITTTRKRLYEALNA